MRGFGVGATADGRHRVSEVRRDLTSPCGRASAKGFVGRADVAMRRARSAALTRLMGRFGLGAGVVSAALALVAAVPASASASVMAPEISTHFGAASIPVNGSTSLSFSIGNPNSANSGIGLAGVGFSDALPVGLVVATPSGLSGDCGGTVSAAAGSSSVSLSEGSLPAGTVCTISMHVTGTWGGRKSNSVTVVGGGLTGNTSTAAMTVTVPARARVYWTDDIANSIAFENLDGSGGGDLTTTGATVNGPEGVALDPAAGKIYWANLHADKISFAKLDGSGGGDLTTTGATVFDPWGVALDPAARKIYWANGGGISFAKLDGSGGGDLTTTGATVYAPRGVALDPAAGKIYWANSDPVNKIAFANLDDSGGTDLTTTGATVKRPFGVALDPAAGKIYWTNLDADKISFAKLDGRGGGDLSMTEATVGSPDGVALDPAAGKIYWANDYASDISFANLDGSGGGYLTAPVASQGKRFLALLKAPVAAGAPAVTGGSTVGSVLSCSRGTWTPDLVGSFLYRAPRSFAYRWSVNGADISGATARTYTASAPGDYRCRVTASNAAGGASQTSTPRTIVPPPSVTGFSPPSGVAGSTVVTITGSNVAGAIAVKFNGLPARVSSDAATQITATVPNGATTGRISVSTPGGTATSASSFAVTFTLSGVSPASGPTGTDVTITGTGFTATSSVKFNGVAATVLSRTPPTKLVAVVPATASTGKITVTNTTPPVGTVTSATSFTKT
jgi:DNA-binding beta-propeller fold protein YncE